MTTGKKLISIIDNAGFAVFSFPFLYHFMKTEQVIFFVITAFSAFGIIRGGLRIESKKLYYANLMLFLLSSSIFLYMTFYDDKNKIFEAIFRDW